MTELTKGLVVQVVQNLTEHKFKSGDFVSYVGSQDLGDNIQVDQFCDEEGKCWGLAPREYKFIKQ